MPDLRATALIASAASCLAALLAAGGSGAVGAAPTPTSTTPAPTTPASTAPLGVAASIAYSDGSKSTVPVWKNIRVTIKRGDALLVDGRLLPEAARQSVTKPPKLRAIDLDNDGEAEVLIDVYAAGADCCRRSVVYHRTGSTYADQVLDWSTSGYRLADVVGLSSPEFLAADTRIPRAWNSTARGPLRVMGLRDGKVQDLSSRAPAQLRRDLDIHRRALRSLRRTGGDTRPVVAAYVADLIRLGEVREARGIIRSAARRHELRASTSTFERSLDRKLLTWGYTKRRTFTR
jgi:hypothetical protein